ncbi:MAG: GvpL/GvpF family gas vesicle protein, partial [Chloroflexi bacterium]|nr:GvpL/GvpF family gas vesicle protein [Chloroflexota bacterium]
MTRQGKYLYCIIRCSEERVFEDVAPMAGGDGPVHTVPSHGLATVVSDSPAQEYESTRANLLAHQRVLEKVMGEFTLLPVRFGTIADSASPDQELRSLLERRFDEFDRLLVELEGKVELGVKALWRDEKAVFEEILIQNEDIRALRNSLNSRGTMPATHIGRIRLGEMVKEALDLRRATEAASLLAPLRPLAVRLVENPIWVDRMVANAAFLVNKTREGEFDKTVKKLDQERGSRVFIRYVGPVPAYN